MMVHVSADLSRADLTADESSTEVPTPPEVPRESVAADRLPRVLEAVLMVAEEPVPVAELAAGLGVPVPDLDRVLRELAEGYEDGERGFALRQVGAGWRFYSHGDCADEVARFLLAGQTGRLSAAALETLAVIAYRQPVSRSRIAGIRGVNVDGVVRTLVARGLVTEVATDESTQAVLYGTTPAFLEKLGIRSLEELPPLAPLLPDLAEMEAEQPEGSTGEPTRG
jgi:segregation and condensation protein B